MEIYISDQLTCIVYAILLGIFYGLIYDFLKHIRNFFNNKLTIKALKEALDKRNNLFLKNINKINYKKTTLAYKIKLFFWDLLFFIIITPITQIFIYATSFGIVRWYIFFAIGVGFMLYYVALSKLTRYVFEPIVFLFIILKEYIKLPFKRLIKSLKYKAMLRKNKKQLKLKNREEMKKKTNRKELLCYGQKR